jgi:hypothetical protein
MIVLVALLGALAVRRLRSGRPRLLGMLTLAFALLVPISARALPYTFANGAVADANQVNANFAAVAGQQGLEPTASANLVDLAQSTTTCPGQPTGLYNVNNLVGADGLPGPFSTPSGQTLVLSSLDATIFTNTVSANHAVKVGVYRQGAGGAYPVATTVITLNGQGAGAASLSFGAGSAFPSGSNICVAAFDINAGTYLSVPLVSAHGFLTTL